MIPLSKQEIPPMFPFIGGRKRSSVVAQKMGTVFATGNIGLVFEGTWNINYRF